MNRSMEQVREKIESLKEEAKKLGVVLNISEDTFHEFRQHRLWYGGAVADFEYRGIKVYIEVNGDVYADLYDENGEYITHVKDNSNTGNFFHDMRDSIRNDEELIKLLGWDYDPASDIKPCLEVADNNWIEFSLYNTKNSKWILVSDSVIDDTDDVLDAVDEEGLMLVVDEILDEDNGEEEE